jgi:hypothetical protein
MSPIRTVMDGIGARGFDGRNLMRRCLAHAATAQVTGSATPRHARIDLTQMTLGGQLKTGNLWTGQNRQFLSAETSEFYFVPSSVRKSVCTFVRQLRGPHFSTCA